MVGSSKDEMEKLQKLRTELESRLAAIEEEQKTVEEETKVLREKAAIRELERKMREKQDALANLRIEKKELEDKIKAPNEEELEDTSKTSTKLSISEAIQKTKEEIEKKKNALEMEEEENQRVIWKKDDQAPEDAKPEEDESKEPSEDESKESEEEEEKKKKLKFF
jgi:hypothetical protein